MILSDSAIQMKNLALIYHPMTATLRRSAAKCRRQHCQKQNFSLRRKSQTAIAVVYLWELFVIGAP
ncbi:MAG: hypothetical protein BGO05_24480 [Rhizobiales bacterium 63-7]|nr:MAG: hypothetical protein BGO05_24480 [Rhizobiales bacterium 63-7]